MQYLPLRNKITNQICIWLGLLMVLTVYPSGYALAQTSSCTAEFENIPEQPVVGKEYSVTAIFRNCKPLTLGTLLLRNKTTNTLTSLGSVLMVNGSDSLTVRNTIPAGQYVFEATNSETSIPFFVNSSPTITVVSSLDTTNQDLTTAPPQNINATASDQTNNTQNQTNQTTTTNQTSNTQNQTNQTTTSNSGNTTTVQPSFVEGIVTNPISYNSLGELIVGLIRFLLIMVGALSVLFIIIGSVRLVTSAGNEKTVTAGKQTVTWAVIGLVVALLAFTLISVVQNILGRN